MKKINVNSQFYVAIGAIFCCALWGISTPIVKIGQQYINSSHVPSLVLWVGIQFILAGLVSIIVYSAVSKKLVCPKKENFKGVALISILQTVLQYTLLYFGLLHTTSVKGAILKSTDVFLVALIASLLFRQEKLTAKKLISCIIGFSGIIIMNLNGLSLCFSPLGDGIVLLAIISYSFSVVITKAVTKGEDPITLSSYQMLLGGIIMTAFGAALSGRINSVKLIPIILGLSLLYAVSYVLWTVLLKYNPASSVTIYSFTTPIFGVVFSKILLNENSGVSHLNLAISLFLVCFGIILWGYEKKIKEK